MPAADLSPWVFYRVGSIGIVSIVGQNINIKFTNIAKGLGSTVSDHDLSAAEVKPGMYRRRNMSDFLKQDESVHRGESNQNGSSK